MLQASPAVPKPKAKGKAKGAPVAPKPKPAVKAKAKSSAAKAKAKVLPKQKAKAKASTSTKKPSTTSEKKLPRGKSTLELEGGADNTEVVGLDEPPKKRPARKDSSGPCILLVVLRFVYSCFRFSCLILQCCALL